MPKLRKMLGEIDSQECIDLMRLLETQSATTLAKWAVSYAKETYLPIYQTNGAAEDSCLDGVIANCEKYLASEMKLAELKPSLKEAREFAAKVQGEVAQAAARAVSTACATIQTPTNALGYLFYGAAAVAYNEAGLEESAEVYDVLASKELRKAWEVLKTVAVKKEPNPAKINWNC